MQDDRSSLPDDILVKRVVGGDTEIYRVLVERYEKRVFALTFEILRSKEDAEDVTQESFVKAYLSLPDFKGEASFYTWLYRIAYNLAIDLKRKVNRRGGPPAEFDETSTQSAGALRGTALIGAVEAPHEALNRREQNIQIRRALESISEEHRAVILLRELEGLSYEEISDVIGISLGTVMSRLHYARKRLQKVLAEHAPGGEITETNSERSPQDVPSVEDRKPKQDLSAFRISQGTMPEKKAGKGVRLSVNLLSALCVIGPAVWAVVGAVADNV